VAAAPVRELGGDGVDRRQHAADAKAGDHPPHRQAGEPRDGRRHDHARHHYHQAAEDGRPAADPVGEAAEDD
jgi:hypothetical protein